MSTPDLSSLIFCGDGECDHPAWMNEEKRAWGKLLKEWEGTYTVQFARPAMRRRHFSHTGQQSNEPAKRHML